MQHGSLSGEIRAWLHMQTYHMCHTAEVASCGGVRGGGLRGHTRQQNLDQADKAFILAPVQYSICQSHTPITKHSRRRLHYCMQSLGCPVGSGLPHFYSKTITVWHHENSNYAFIRKCLFLLCSWAALNNWLLLMYKTVSVFPMNYCTNTLQQVNPVHVDYVASLHTCHIIAWSELAVSDGKCRVVASGVLCVRRVWIMIMSWTILVHCQCHSLFATHWGTTNLKVCKVQASCWSQASKERNA